MHSADSQDYRPSLSEQPHILYFPFKFITPSLVLRNICPHCRLCFLYWIRSAFFSFTVYSWVLPVTFPTPTKLLVTLATHAHPIENTFVFVNMRTHECMMVSACVCYILSIGASMVTLRMFASIWTANTASWFREHAHFPYTHDLSTYTSRVYTIKTPVALYPVSSWWHVFNYVRCLCMCMCIWMCIYVAKLHVIFQIQAASIIHVGGVRLTKDSWVFNIINLGTFTIKMMLTQGRCARTTSHVHYIKPGRHKL
jgi:hypothetical protein